MPAFDLPVLPIPTDVNGVPHITSPDDIGKLTVASSQWFKKSGLWVPVSAADRLPVDSLEKVIDGPVTGIKTVTATAAEIFAGGSVKASRRKLIVKNESRTMRFRVGKSNVTQQNGFPVEPGAVVGFEFDPAVAVPIYAISEGANLEASVMEI